MPILDEPTIKFTATPDKVMADEEFILEWQVENARKVKLDGLDQDLTSSYKARIDLSKTFELTAMTWTNKVSQHLTVNLHTPIIILFEANSRFILENEPVVINFRAQYAIHWQMVVEYLHFGGGTNTIIGEGKISDGYQIFEHSLSALLSGPCTIRLLLRNGYETSVVDIIRLGVRKVSIELLTDKSIVTVGSNLRLRWKAENAHKITLSPGNIDVTQLSYFDLAITEERDFQVEITAHGDFGSQHSDIQTLHLAKINYFDTSNNGDVNNPEFYLNWSGTGIEQMKLLPHNIIVRETTNRYSIPLSTLPITYTLIGNTATGEEITKSVDLLPCSLEEPSLGKGFAIIGNMATLRWKTTNAKSIQIEFSDSIAPIVLPANENSYHFQVFEARSQAKVIVWGSINLVQADIPIPRFIGPEIKLLQVPVLNLQLGITWMTSPVINSSQNAHELFSMIQKTGEKNGGLYQLLKVISYPSNYILYRYPLAKRRLAEYQFRLEQFPYGFLNFSSQLLKHLIKNLKQQLNKAYHEQQQ